MKWGTLSFDSLPHTWGQVAWTVAIFAGAAWALWAYWRKMEAD